MYLDLKKLDEYHMLRDFIYDLNNSGRALLCEYGLHQQDIRMFKTNHFSGHEASLLMQTAMIW